MTRPIGHFDWKNPIEWEARRIYGENVAAAFPFRLKGFRDGYNGHVSRSFLGGQINQGRNRTEKKEYAESVEHGKLVRYKHDRLIGILISQHEREDVELPRELVEAIDTEVV
jgi:hypothetical protein